ncbi:MAG: TonB-dependent receptor, partial [Halieaceae bacterium]|nr:TonB-dependent receptor [Halieaceae bacterium]
YTNNVSDAQIAPTASFGFWDINCDNPFIQDNPGVPLTEAFGCSPEDIATGALSEGALANHRNVEGGGRNSRLENTAFRWVGGVNGSFNDIWRWNAFAQYSQTSNEDFATNYFITDKVQQALLVTTDENGNPVCIDQSGGCVPYNIFQRSNGEALISQEALDFVSGVGIISGSTRQTVFGGDVQADLGEYGLSLPWTDAGVGVLVGVEYREDELDSNPDQINREGQLAGSGGVVPPVAGAIEVAELFAEIEVPIITDAPLARELTLRGQYRYSDYEANGNDVTNTFETNSYGASLSWAPISDVKFRAQYQRAVRAPNVIELYEGRATGLPNLSPAGINADGVTLFDPCASSSPIASFEACARTGVTQAQYGRILDPSAGQVPSITGGNPNLDPEEADTVTFGVVITPEAIPSLTLSLDYFDIQIDNAIAAGLPAQTTLDSCLATGAQEFCSLILRSANGDLEAGQDNVGFLSTNINIAERATSGLDLQANYSFDLNGGHSLRLDYAATLLDELSLTPFPGAETLECAGFFGNACTGGDIGTGANPEYRHRLNLSWYTPWSLQVVATWRYFGETDNDLRTDEFQATLDAVNYFDVNASYDITDNLTVRVGALNLFGEQPPVFTGAGPALGNGNTYPTVFDIGTQMFASLRATF